MLVGVLRRDTAVVAVGLVLLVLIAAAYTVLGVGMEISAIQMTATRGSGDGGMAAMPGMAGMAMTPAAWTPGYALLVALMWWIMMIAMMVPGAAPTVLLFAALKRAAGAADVERLAGLFVAGYLAVWAGFALAATGLQWALELGGAVAPERMAVTSRTLGGALLLAAGLYQLSPLKRACLHHCRHPADFLSRHRRPGRAGAFAMGLHHGAWCLGCCWALMALLFVGGIMNLYWIVGLALVVLAEKLLPGGARLARVGGAVLVAAGLWLIAGGAPA